MASISEELQDLLEEGIELASRTFAEDGHVSATAIVVTSEEAVLLAMDGSEGPVSKNEFRSAIQEAIRDTKATGVCILAEIWYDTVPAHALNNPLPENRQRLEGLLVCAEDKSGKTVCMLSRIHRDESKPIELGEWKRLGNIEVAGVFSGFFKAPAARKELLN